MLGRDAKNAQQECAKPSVMVITKTLLIWGLTLFFHNAMRRVTPLRSTTPLRDNWEYDTVESGVGIKVK